VEHIRKLATRKNCEPSQLALAWVLAQGKDIVPIPGTKRRNYLEENVAAAEIELTPEDLKSLQTVAPVGIASGLRYPEHLMGVLGR
jgi:aryl-alcohol dehydrogenase-like predicted oxidoreductase